jgi:glycosyltransferase involved in cell wall biosynthesis
MTGVPAIHPLLSIVTGFHNSTIKSQRLLRTLAGMTDADTEFVFVDDGSTDGTFECLLQHKETMRCACTVIQQENKGPGGARNRGLQAASGKYVWFVDSDDNINPDVVRIVRELGEADYDFIDFGIQRLSDVSGQIQPSRGARVGELKLPEGAHSAEVVTRLFLLRYIGWLVTKVFRRDFLLAKHIRYPENCVYEDTLLFFWLPLVVNHFYKSDTVGYFHHQERESITRTVGRKGGRFFDRLAVAATGVEKAMTFDLDARERARVGKKFTNIFLVHTLEMLRESGDWMMFPRILKLYREETARLSIRRIGLREIARQIGPATVLAWLVSYLYPSQRDYFAQVHQQSWGRPIVY